MKTYHAILEGDRIKWADQVVPPATDQPMPVTVTMPDKPDEQVKTRGQQAAEALSELATLNPFRDIKDPVAWQREIRKDRPLIGRE